MFDRLKKLRRLNNSKLTDDEYYETDANGRGVIDVGAENYDDIFSYYDQNCENVLDQEFDDFLRAKADAIPEKEELAIHFHVANPTDEKLDEIDGAVKSHYKRELRALNRELHKNSMFTLYMLIMGIISFGLYIVMSIFWDNPYVIEIFDIIAWVFLWEAVDNHFLRRKNIQDQRLKIYRFVRADITIYEYKRKNNNPKLIGKNKKAFNQILKLATQNDTTTQKNKKENL
ncbi:MAG: hypothetical protein E7378_02265 [Clostridiales bacterium]|nr:hypothetical protein [Clostridiales bacterium]